MKRLLDRGARRSGGSSHRPPVEYHRCPRCGGGDLATAESQTKAGLRLKVVCADCSRFVRFAPLPWTPERAHAFVIPFGKHRGHTIGELTRTLSGWDYLEWAGKNWHNNAGQAARVALAAGPLYEPDGGGHDDPTR